MKIKIDGFIGAYHWGDPERKLTLFHFCTDANKDPDYIEICAHSIEVEIPTPPKEELTAKTIALLTQAKQEVYIKAAEVAARCEDKIQRLLALANEAPAQSTEIDDDTPF